MSKNSRNIVVASVIAIIIGFLIGCVVWNTGGENLIPLPAPELSEGERGELGIDKNINESNIDKYLGRSDSVYYDLRMLEDPASYENIGGDRHLSGYIRGFEVVPFPYITNVTDLPAEVGNTYQGETLFTKNDSGNYVANYREAMQIITDLFPKDKYIFLMCGGGGYAGMMKKMLVKFGWNEEKIYVVGGFWNYDGKNLVEIKDSVNGETYYAYWKVPYHEIDFSKLTKLM